MVQYVKSCHILFTQNIYEILKTHRVTVSFPLLFPIHMNTSSLLCAVVLLSQTSILTLISSLSAIALL